MSEGIIAALIAAGASVIVQIIAAARQSKVLLQQIEAESRLSDARLDAKLEKYQAVTNEKIEELTRETRKHNQFAQRMPVLEEKVANLEKRREP